MKLHSSISVLLLAAAVQTAGAYDFESGGIYYNFISVSERTVSVVAGDEQYSGNIVIPDSIYYNGVPFVAVSIGQKAFYEASKLESISFPPSLRTIGTDAFNRCTGLKAIYFSEGLVEIGTGGFSTCTSLKGNYPFWS